MILALEVAGAGALGAVCRYLLDGALQQRWRGAFPIGTFAINVSGSLLLGILTGVYMAHGGASPDAKAIAGTGFVGAYTTFSTLTFESLQLLREGSAREALTNLFGSVVVGLGAALAGIWLGQRF
ncbi:MAG: fluoride efflux transporter CrcB [Actinomycetota bacterium]